ncbi:MAG: hypothetical protein MUO23_02700 [Anaerolineales bacterium]|nr:hypothetical protein [Anaerolineales bacterium]
MSLNSPYPQPHPTRTPAVAIAVFAAMVGGCAGLLPSPQPGSILFQDDFSRASSGWDRYRDSSVESDYSADTYQIAVYEPERIAWSRPGLRFTDVVIDVDATVTDGPENNALGVICRYQDPQNFYFFLISADGFAGIGQRLDGVQTMFNDAAMLPADSIVHGQSTNHLRAECSGPRLTLSINGVPARQAAADAFESGDVGLLAGTYDLPGTRVSFDSFSVRQPELPLNS